MMRAAFAALLVACNLAAQDAPKILPPGYRVETIATPKGVAFGVGGMDFAADGTLYVCTREGDVWTRRGDEWRRFASGLHEPLGILVDSVDKVDSDHNRVFVVQRPELTELIDRDGNGVADEYRTVSAAWGLTDNYHEYAFGLIRDDEGNFYGTLNTTLSWKGWAGSDKWDLARVHDGKMGRAAKYRGWSWRVTPAGLFEPWSAGMRSPCGIGRNKLGEIFYTDNQGDWVATSGLHHVVKGRFHGHPSSLMDHPDWRGVDLNSVSIEKYGEVQTPPAVYFPHGDLASSPGEPVWDETAGKFGPFVGQVFLGDQTRSNLFRVQIEQVDGVYQGCAINFIDHLQCGVVRCRFAPDGSLWCGQTGRGWGSRGPAPFGLQRILWDGATTPFAIEAVSVARAGFVLRFTLPVDAVSATATASYEVRRWRYRYQPEYGSKKFDAASVKVEAATLSSDATSVELTLDAQSIESAEREAGALPWVYSITTTVKSEAPAATLTTATAYYTLHRWRK